MNLNMNLNAKTSDSLAASNNSPTPREKQKQQNHRRRNPPHKPTATQQKKPGSAHATGLRVRMFRRSLLVAIIADSLHRAALHGLRAQSHLIISRGLLLHIGNALVIISGEKVRSGFAAKITVDAVAVYIELARNILFSFFIDIGHFVYGGLFPTPIFTDFEENAIIFYCKAAFLE